MWKVFDNDNSDGQRTKLTWAFGEGELKHKINTVKQREKKDPKLYAYTEFQFKYLVVVFCLSEFVSFLKEYYYLNDLTKWINNVETWIVTDYR